MTQVLYLKWRPKTWTEVVGQEHVITTLRNAVKHDRVSHAQLFSGPRGTGKTSTARLLAKAVNCLAEDLSARPCNQCAHCQAVNRGEFLDLIEIDAASNTSVDDVRDLREKINFSPNQGRYKVYIIDEVHMLSKPAFNALLKTLEEPPEHAMFILATTEPHKIPTTVLSRCQRHDFRRIPVDQIVAQLQEMAAAEGLQVEKGVLPLMARQATGSLRDAISILDQLSSAEGSITLELAHQVLGTSTNQAVLDLTGALISGNASQGLDTLHEAAARGSDPRQFNRQIIGYLRNMLLLKMGNSQRIDLPAEMLTVLRQHSSSLTVTQILELIRIFNEAVNDRGGSWMPILPLEMAFVEGLNAAAGNHPGADDNTGGSPPPDRQQPGPADPQPGGAEEQPTASGQSPADELSGERTPGAVLKKWSIILEQISRESPSTHGLLRACQPLGIQDGDLVLSFRDETMKTKLEKDDHLQVCQRVIERVLGIPLPLCCVIRAADQQGLPDSVDPEGLVATAVRDLGGKYVSDQPDQGG
jgi:DNA polymerase-3 subunit gamma/tau